MVEYYIVQYLAERGGKKGKQPRAPSLVKLSFVATLSLFPTSLFYPLSPTLPLWRDFPQAPGAHTVASMRKGRAGPVKESTIGRGKESAHNGVNSDPHVGYIAPFGTERESKTFLPSFVALRFVSQRPHLPAQNYVFVSL